ncbi:molybdopterin-dependent oxidoreductase [Flavimaricola marinus]|uniref:Oxidoreductase molybdopterin binding domain protein n=1 Tax=Flavimaricola marinus TaxID=1819565 RepID=A0A238LFI4_9RHOB|nr:molybdopterin-dependent oxidoreductase [Flavimaricola marinus]SMY07660.1 Oxidoreductase molybdopterin binding domain protein [Flavimaricola marinus]
MRIPTFFGLTAALIAAPMLISAETPPAPTGEVVLRISGADLPHNVDDALAFDMEMLRDIEATEVETSTIWTDGVQTFVGVSLAAMMEHIGVEDGMLFATAINDYTVEIPVSDAVEGGPIIAYEQNGRPMSVRDKGPLWIVYPFDSSAEYRTEVVYSRSIWQLDRIEIVD